MKPFTFAFAIVACTGLAFAQTPATVGGQAQQKQFSARGQKPQPTSKPLIIKKSGINNRPLFNNQIGLGVGSDDCSGATAISGSGVFPFDATAATTGAEGQNEYNCYSFGSSAVDNDVWYEWTNTDCDGTVVVSTCNDASADTKIAAYPGGGCPADGSSLACNDDASGCGGFTSEMSFAVTAGSSYMLQIGHFPNTAGGSGNVTITTNAPCITTGTDGCADASPIAGDGVFPFDATAATAGAEGQNEYNCYSFGSSAVDSDVWFEWTADTNGSVVVSTCNDASADTKIASYPGGGCPADGSSLACNDDASGCGGFTSEMSFLCAAGSSYMLQIGHFPNTAGGSGNVTITQTYLPPVGENCANPFVISGDGSFAYDNSGSQTDAEGQNEGLCYDFGSSAIDNDIWFEWTATINGNAVVETCGSSPDTKIGAYDGAGCPADGSAIACNDDTCGLQSQISFACAAGSSYMIECGNFPGAVGGATTLVVNQTASCSGTADDCAAASSIAGQGTFCFDNSGATTGAEGQNEGICYDFGSSAVDNDIWFEWTADADGQALVTLCNGTAMDSKLGIYPGGGCPAAGSALACNDDTCSLQSEVSTVVTNGSSYMIQVGNFPGATGGFGTFDISISPILPPHPYDDCATTTGVAVDGVNLTDTTGASYGSNPATSDGGYANQNAWYSYTAGGDGLVVMAMCNVDGSPAADYDTKLAAWDACGGNLVASNDDYCGLASAIAFNAVGGQVYMVEVGGFGGGIGTGGLGIFSTTGIPYCVGDGSGTACPCGNNNPGGPVPAGCVNSASSAGTLVAQGDASVSGDTLQLYGSGLVGGLPCLFFSGENAINGGAGITFGDGLRCAGFNAIRLEVTASDASGVTLTTGAVGGGNVAGQVVNYQLWYRDATGVCGSSHNMTNGLQVVWGS